MENIFLSSTVKGTDAQPLLSNDLPAERKRTLNQRTFVKSVTNSSVPSALRHIILEVFTREKLLSTFTDISELFQPLALGYFQPVMHKDITIGQVL